MSPGQMAVTPWLGPALQASASAASRGAWLGPALWPASGCWAASGSAAANTRLWGEGRCGDGSAPPHDSAGPPLPWLPALRHRHCPPQSPPSPPLDPPPQGQQQPSSWDRSTIPQLRDPVRGVYGCSQDCVMLIPFRLPQISCFTLSLKRFSSDSDNCPDVGIRPASVPPSWCGRTNAPAFPLVASSYWVLSGSVYSFLWSGPPVCSELVFCTHFCVWRWLPDVPMDRDVLHVHLLLHHLQLIFF